MQKDKDKDKIITSVEIVDVPPKNTETSTILSNELAEVGATQLSKEEEVYRLFNGRNLAFVSTLSKDGSPNVTPVWADIENDMILINTSEAAAKKEMYETLVLLYL